MTRTVIRGINGSNPLGFMASVGLLRLVALLDGGTRLGFMADGTFHAWIECDLASDEIPGIVTKDAEDAAGPQPWRLKYKKQEKKGLRVVADLKPPPDQFSRFLDSAIDEWAAGRPERADYAAAYGTDVARDNRGNTKPTAFHFTAANQQFLGAVEAVRRKLTIGWVEESFGERDGKSRPGINLRWDPGAERSRALMGVNPIDDGTVVDAPLEWLAFRGLPAFPCAPVGSRIVTCGVHGRRQNDLRFHWPLWSCGATYATVRSLLVLNVGWIEKEERIRRMIERHSGSAQGRRSLARLRLELERVIGDRRARGVFASCTSKIRRTAQGFGNFGPANVSA